MGNELFQARIPDELADEVHEYLDERHMSKSEAVRKGLRELVDEDDEAEVVESTTRTLRSGGMASQFLQLLQTALLLGIAVLVVGP